MDSKADSEQFQRSDSRDFLYLIQVNVQYNARASAYAPDFFCDIIYYVTNKIHKCSSPFQEDNRPKTSYNSRAFLNSAGE